MAFYKDADPEAFENLMTIVCFIEIHPDFLWELLEPFYSISLSMYISQFVVAFYLF